MDRGFCCRESFGLLRLCESDWIKYGHGTWSIKANDSQVDCDTPFVFAKTGQSEVYLYRCAGLDCISGRTSRLPLRRRRHPFATRRGQLVQVEGSR